MILRREHEPCPSLSALVIITAVVIFSPLLEGGTTHLAVMVVRLLVLSLFALFLWKGVFDRRLRWPALPIGMPVVVFLTLAAGSTMFSRYANQSWQWLFVLVSYALLLYLVACFVTDWGHIRKLMAVIVAMGFAEASVALWQGIVWQMPRPHGTFFNPNFLAGYLCMSSTILIGLLVCSRFRWRGLGFPQTSYPLIVPGILTMLAVVLCALLWTGSRGGLIAMITGTGVVFALRFGLWQAGGVVAVALGCFLLIPNPIRERSIREHVANAESYSRVQMWQRSLDQMADHPFGVGLGLYQYTYPRYAFPVEGEITRYGKVAQTPHNEYLQIGVELGSAAVLVFVWAVILAGRQVSFLIGQRLKRWQRGIVLGTSGGVASILTHAALDSNLHEPAIAILFAICVGLLCAASFRVLKPVPTTIVPMKSRPLWGALTAMLVLALGLEIIRLGAAWAAFESGGRYSSQNQTAAAIASLGLAASLDPGKALYHRALAVQHARQYEQTGNIESARTATRELEIAAELNPLDGRLHALLGELYSRWSYSSQAAFRPEQQRALQLNSLQAYHRASELAPFAAAYRLEQAKLYASLRDLVSAERHAREAVMLEPNYLPARGLLAGLYIDLKKVREANNELQEIQDRQLRYADWAKNPLEEAFLTVDVTPIRFALDRLPTSG